MGESHSNSEEEQTTFYGRTDTSGIGPTKILIILRHYFFVLYMWINNFVSPLYFCIIVFGFQDARNEINNNTVHITNRLRKSKEYSSHNLTLKDRLDCTGTVAFARNNTHAQLNSAHVRILYTKTAPTPDIPSCVWVARLSAVISPSPPRIQASTLSLHPARHSSYPPSPPIPEREW